MQVVPQRCLEEVLVGWHWGRGHANPVIPLAFGFSRALVVLPRVPPAPILDGVEQSYKRNQAGQHEEPPS